MADQKIDNLLNLAMEATPEERIKSENLNEGYNPEEKFNLENHFIKNYEQYRSSFIKSENK